MTLLLRLALPLLLSLLPPVAAWAQTTPPAPAAPAAPTAASAKPPSAGESQALQLFKLLDTNGDGRVSRAEAEVAIRLKPSLAELFRRTDTNGDGYLTQDEIRAEAARLRIEAGDEDVDPHALFEQVTVDKARLARHIRHALQDRAQVTLAALVAAQPLEQGLAELIAYLQLGSDAFTTTLDEATPEPIEWQASAADGSTVTRRARLPRVIFMR